MMTNKFKAFLMMGASPALILLAGPALAQSTGTQTIETVVVSADKVEGGGVMSALAVPKQRSTITQDFIKTQSAGQTIFESLNFVPGFNFTNSDPYGNSGGNVRLHGFDGARISFTWDGMPLNDTGNYALYTNQVADSEIIASASVNQGSTDADSPTAAATGGVIAIRTSKPNDEMGLSANVTGGSFNKVRAFVRVDSGTFGPWDTKAFATYSYNYYDKWKGPGYLQKRQYNFNVYQDLGDTGWVSVAGHFNQNRNNFYNSVSFLPVRGNAGYWNPATLAAVTSPVPPGGAMGVSAPTIALDDNGNYVGVGNPRTADIADGYGLRYDQASVCPRPAPVNGTTQLEATSNGGTTSICTGYYNVRINPSDTGNIRIASLLHLSDDLSLTIDPSIQYVRANGGGITVLNETDPRLKGTTTAAGVDLNGDRDFLDQINVFSPNNTNTIRYGLNTSLLWKILPGHTVQAAYTLDFGLHRQTGQMAYLDPNGNPYDVFGGYRDIGHRVLSADGTPIRTRDRRSTAILNQVAFAYEGEFLNDEIHVSAGVRAPFLQRNLNQMCYTGATGSFNQINPGPQFQYCTSAAPLAPAAANGTVQFAGQAGNASWTTPFEKTVKYNRVLPNVGISWSPWAEHQFYAAFATSLSAPRTDNLYNGGNNGKCLLNGAINGAAPGCVFSGLANVKPETTQNYSLGYRYNSSLLNFSLSGFNTQFKHRIQSTFDADQGISVDRDIGSVNFAGVDAEADLFLMEDFSIYTSISYIHTRVADGPLSRICQNASCSVSISFANKEIVETPNWTLSQRYQYKIAGFVLGLGGKYVGRRYATDTNDYRVPSYFTANADITYDLGELGWEGAFLRFNATNLFNEKYFGNIQTTRPCFTPRAPTTTGCTSYPSLVVGFPQTFEGTLGFTF